MIRVINIKHLRSYLVNPGRKADSDAILYAVLW
jgi:hypothetical protein